MGFLHFNFPHWFYTLTVCLLLSRRKLFQTFVICFVPLKKHSFYFFVLLCIFVRLDLFLYVWMCFCMFGCVFVFLDVFLYVWMYFWSGSEPPGWKGVCSEENTFPPEKHGITPEGGAFLLFLCDMALLPSISLLSWLRKICMCMWWSMLSHSPDSSYPKERCSFLACYN